MYLICFRPPIKSKIPPGMGKLTNTIKSVINFCPFAHMGSMKAWGGEGARLLTFVTSWCAPAQLWRDGSGISPSGEENFASCDGLQSNYNSLAVTEKAFTRNRHSTPNSGLMTSRASLWRHQNESPLNGRTARSNARIETCEINGFSNQPNCTPHHPSRRCMTLKCEAILKTWWRHSSQRLNPSQMKGLSRLQCEDLIVLRFVGIFLGLH